MKRVIAVVLIAALTTLMVGVDRTSWASQGRDQKKREAQREEVANQLRDMGRGSTVRIERTDGTEMDAVIQEITPDAITVLVEHRGLTATQTIAIADIKTIEKVSLKKMSKRSKGLIIAAVAVGALVATVLVSSCAASLAVPRQKTPAAN